jgi:hypothetical protein
VSRPRFARRVRGRRALTLAFAPRLIIQLSGGCQILLPRTGLRAESLSEEIWDLRKTCSNKHSPTSMRIITYSDLHLEFGSGWILPPAVNGDVMILADRRHSLWFLRPLISISVKNEITKRHGRIDDQSRMVCGGFVFANVPVAHLVTEAG